MKRIKKQPPSGRKKGKFKKELPEKKPFALLSFSRTIKHHRGRQQS